MVPPRFGVASAAGAEVAEPGAEVAAPDGEVVGGGAVVGDGAVWHAASKNTADEIIRCRRDNR